MKKIKKLTTMLLAGAVAAAGFAAFAADAVQPVSPILAPISAGDPAAPAQGAYGTEMNTPYYMSYTGKVTELRPHSQLDGAQYLTLESEEYGPASPLVTADTYVVGGEVAVGDTVTLFYEADKPMLMIYPPQYNAAILLVNPDEDFSVAADLFDDNLLSRDKGMVLRVGDKTELRSPDGTPYEGSPAGNRLLVFYTVAAESWPVQVTPEKVIVLGKPEASFTPPVHISAAELVVGGKTVEAPPAFVSDDGAVMVPLRAIAEALGYEVTWEGATGTVYLNTAISLQIGQDNYVYMRMAPITLGAAPVLRDSRTFVPLNYFREVLGLNNAYFAEGQIVIDDAEKME
ncbi:MAG TPA: copper amine oxidase N-terminal domain-containing protein [Candidatus Acidoferrum sp.]|nr:copper amine oxidase N-terminal domain-containing protein [Candidatus Acidoferrum sp.]